MHLLAALTRQKEGIVVPVLQRLGADPRDVAAGADERLAAAAKAQGDLDVGLSRALVQTLETAQRISGNFRTSTSRPSTCCWPSPEDGTRRRTCCASSAPRRQGILAALREVRGNRV